MGEPLPRAIASDVPPISPGHGYPSRAHTESYSMHTHAFQRYRANYSQNEPFLPNFLPNFPLSAPPKLDKTPLCFLTDA